MIKLCFMPSYGGYPTPAFGLGSSEIIKNPRPYLMSPPETKQELKPTSSFSLKPDQLDPWKPVGSLGKSSQFVEIDSAMMRPLLIDAHDTQLGSHPFTLRIAEQCARQEEVMKFLVSRSNEFKEGGFDMSMLSDLMGQQALTSSSQLPHAYSVLYMNQEHGKPILDLLEGMVHHPQFEVHPDGQILFSSARAEELNNILSIAADIYLSRNYANGKKLQSLVPQFTRFESEAMATLQLAPEKWEALTVAPLKKTKLKPLPKKHNVRKGGKQRDLYKRNHLHACESLLSMMMMGNDQHKKTTMLSLRRSCTELSELLTHFSIGIAGAGMAVLFSVVYSVASGRVPFCADKFFNTGLGFSLVWMSWAVSKLKETIAHINRKEEEGVEIRVEKSMKEVYLRAATVMAMLALRFA